MSTKDQLLYSALHGTAMCYAAERRNLAESIEELRQIADGRDDILAKAAGIEAGAWYAWLSTHAGHELVAAGMLIMAGGDDGKPLDYNELERWTRVGWAVTEELNYHRCAVIGRADSTMKPERCRYSSKSTWLSLRSLTRRAKLTWRCVTDSS
jgi:hypothetical protein